MDAGQMASLRNLIVCFGLLVASTASAHDHNRPDLNGWYESLHSPGGGPCCDMSDTNHVNDLDWETQSKDSSHYRVRIDGKWIDVPDDKVVEAPNKAGFAMEWHYYFDGEPIIRCFMPGQMS
jgi:hypothetical protein